MDSVALFGVSCRQTFCLSVPGAGNLLDNLLCALVGLLASGAPLVGILNLLNRITKLLG